VTPKATQTRDFVRYNRSLGVDGLEVMNARWVEHSFKPHMHDFYAISLNDRGRGAFDCQRERHDATPGTCNLVAPGELHTGHAISGASWSYRNLHIELPLMKRLLQDIEQRERTDMRFKCSLVRDTVLSARLARVFASLSESSSLLEIGSLLLSVVARLSTTHFTRRHALDPTGREQAAITRTQEWLDAHSEQNVSIRSLADAVGLSPYYLVRAFHRQVGAPPHRYQTLVRVNRARKLMTSGATLAEAAFQAGFYDQSHLTRCFKRTFGVTPGGYVRDDEGSFAATSRITSNRKSTSSRRNR
jgi:AraC-like DNA-binding protein